MSSAFGGHAPRCAAVLMLGTAAPIALPTLSFLATRSDVAAYVVVEGVGACDALGFGGSDTVMP